MRHPHPSACDRLRRPNIHHLRFLLRFRARSRSLYPRSLLSLLLPPLRPQCGILPLPSLPPPETPVFSAPFSPRPLHAYASAVLRCRRPRRHPRPTSFRCLVATPLAPTCSSATAATSATAGPTATPATSPATTAATPATPARNRNPAGGSKMGLGACLPPRRALISCSAGLADHPHRHRVNSATAAQPS